VVISSICHSDHFLLHMLFPERDFEHDQAWVASASASMERVEREGGKVNH
jgi:hypothetical protein